MGSAFIETCEDDALAVAARTIAESTGCPELAASVQASAVVEVAMSKRDAILSLPAEKDVEAFFVVLAAAAAKAEGGEQQQLLLLRQILVGVAGGAETVPEHASLRLRVLFSLFNSVPAPAFRYAAFIAALRLATLAKAPDALLPSLKRADEWAKEWALSRTEIRDLYFAVSGLLRESKGGAKESFAFLLKYLGTYEDAPSELPSVVDAAVRAAKTFISASDLHQSDILELAAIKQLASHTVHAPLHKLLVIVLTGKLADYNAWHATNGPYLMGLGLVHEDLVAKMRLLSLVALGAESSSGEVAYDDVQNTLLCESEDVELWVVKAIGAKLLEAKLDQVRRVVIVTRFTYRVFGKPQWESLRRSLQGWVVNVTAVRNGLPNSVHSVSRH